MFRRGVLLLAAGALAAAVREPAARAEPGTALALRFDAAIECPDAATVADALGRQDLRIDDGARLSLELASTADGVAVVLRDGQGTALLDRSLPPDECNALADAVALLVQQRLEGVGWSTDLPSAPVPNAPPPPPAPPTPTARVRAPARPAPRVAAEPLALSVDAGVVVANGIDGQPAAPGPELSVTLWARPVALSLSASWIGRPDSPAAGGTLAVDELPLSLDAALSLRAPRLALGLGPRLALTILRTNTTGLPSSRTQTRVAVRLGPAVALTVFVLPSVYVRAGVAILGLASGWNLRVEGVGIVARQSDWAVEGGATLGFRLPL